MDEYTSILKMKIKVAAHHWLEHKSDELVNHEWVWMYDRPSWEEHTFEGVKMSQIYKELESDSHFEFEFRRDLGDNVYIRWKEDEEK